jgi:glucose/arabinose dehydrogenase
MLIGELGGKIWILQPGATQIDPMPFLQLTNVGTTNSQQGLMDIVLDPQFATNHYYYVFYTLGSPNRDRVSRFMAEDSTTVPGSEFVLWQDAEDANAEHHGGSLNFGNDGKLYITTGEHFNAAEAQSLTNYRGKILRINKDGTVPSDNPFFDGNGPNRDQIWALGLRNPFRAFYDTVSGLFLIGDVGGNDYSVAKEEVNLGIRGANYGWPNCEGPCANQAYTSPIYYYPHNGRDAAITGGFIYRGSQYPNQYYGSYFFADYTQNWIRRLTLDANANVTGVFNFEPLNGVSDGPYGDIVYLSEGPDGAIYYVDLGYSDVGGVFGLSKIRRIRYVSGNQPPIVSASAVPLSGLPPLSVSFSSAGSSDPEGQPLSFSWDLGDGSTSNEANPSHVYTQAGQYTVRLTVSDGNQSTVAAPLTVVVGNRPNVSILFPGNGALFRAGQSITFSGDAVDAEDGGLPASAFSWQINLRHSEHVHPSIPQVGIKEGMFAIPTSGHDFSGDVYYEFILTVTDSTGLQSTASVTIYPEKVLLSFDSLPSGLNLTIDGVPRTTPFTLDTLMLFNHVVDAPQQMLGPVAYTFNSWSDGGAQQHILVAPTSPASHLATYTAAPVLPLPGLVARYAFEEATGSVTADLSGNNNSGTLSGGVSWTTGKFGTGINFGGASGEVVASDAPSLDLTGSFTLMAWVKPDTLAGFHTILIKESSATCGYWLQTNGTQISSGFNAGSGCLDHQTTSANLATGNWYHIAAVLDRTANTFQIYLDGTSILAVPETAAPAPNTESLVLGRTHAGEFWNGSLDDVRIYNRALTPAEIVQVRQGAP